VEPANRDDSHRIPYRFKELEIFTSKRQDRVMLGTKPIVSMGSFTILKPRGNNFAYIFYNTEDVIEAVRQFFYKSLWEDANVPRLDAEKISTSLVGIFEGLIEFEVA
jgi:hydrogenase maturation factor HypE